MKNFEGNGVSIKPNPSLGSTYIKYCKDIKSWYLTNTMHPPQ